VAIGQARYDRSEDFEDKVPLSSGDSTSTDSSAASSAPCNQSHDKLPTNQEACSSSASTDTVKQASSVTEQFGSEEEARHDSGEEMDSKEPGKKEPVSEELVSEELVSEEPVSEEPVSEKPVSEKPVSEEPGRKEPVSEEPGKKEPVIEEPGKKEPVSEEPGRKEPVSEEPVSEELVSEEPGRKEPVNKEPGTNICSLSQLPFVVYDGWMWAEYYISSTTDHQDMSTLMKFSKKLMEGFDELTRQELQAKQYYALV